MFCKVAEECWYGEKDRSVVFFYSAAFLGTEETLDWSAKCWVNFTRGRGSLTA